MILKASQRSGAKQLAIHLLRTDENDHVEVHSIRGFVSDNLKDALQEAYAISRGTKCKQHLFSVSFSPPETEKVSISIFERAIDALEERVGLAGQPRVIVFHEKNGRRHAHCVWSRIKAEEMRAVNLPYYKMKLRDLSRELYIENGWTMPRGLVNSEERNPLNFTREEWQQAKRIDRDPRTIKTIFQDCWAISDSARAFSQAMEARGFYLSRGDRRGFVAVDHMGEVYAIARWVGIKTKEAAAKLGDPDKLPSVEEVKQRLATQVSDKLNRFAFEAWTDFQTARSGLQEQKRKLVAWQRHERKLLREIQAVRWVEESRERHERFRTGLKGLWDRLTGRHASIKKQNEAEYTAAKVRDDGERQSLIDRQLAERKAVHVKIQAHQERLQAEIGRLQTPNAPATEEERPSIRPENDASRPLRKRRSLNPMPS